MTETDLVSIIIPCYNQGEWLAEAIDSGLRQTYSSVQIVVVNDGSTDNTKDVVRPYLERKAIIYLEQANQGVSAARNAGIRVSTGTWILPLDADDLLDPYFVEQTIGRADIVGTSICYFGACHFVEDRAIRNPTFNDLLERNYLFNTSLFKRIVWSTVGGYDESPLNGFEDWEFWVHATKKGFKVDGVGIALYSYRKHGDSRCGRESLRASENASFIRNKHATAVQLVKNSTSSGAIRPRGRRIGRFVGKTKVCRILHIT